MIKRYIEHLMWKRVEQPFLTHHIDELEREVLDGCNTLLDIGCGGGSPVKRFKQHLNYSVGVDAFLPSLWRSKSKQTHSEYVQANIQDISKIFLPKSFDCVLAFDVIEHLTKEQGTQLIDDMETLATRKVIIFTPNGYLPQKEVDGNPYQIHLSGWEVEEMKQWGYRIKGIHGYKLFLGEYSEPKWRPKLLWKSLSILTQRWVENRPNHAFQLFCVKDL
jgi:SAM-dependent methyltransferase